MPNGELPKWCSTCKQFKSLEAFNKNRSEPDGYSHQCRSCKREYYLNNKDKTRESNKRWVINNPDKVRLIKRKDREKRRRDVLEYYSGGALVCLRCGYSDYRALSIDHINGGKNKFPPFAGNSLYVWLKRNSYPEGYQVLCMNCQFIKKLEEGETRSA